MFNEYEHLTYLLTKQNMSIITGHKGYLVYQCLITYVPVQMKYVHMYQLSVCADSQWLVSREFT